MALGSLLAKKQGSEEVDWNDKRFARGLVVDGSASVIAASLGTSSPATFIENAVGIHLGGGRTGLTALVVGVLFLFTLFFYPLVAAIPALATAPALIMVGILMMTNIKHIAWDDITESAPAALTILFMPLTYSITNGLAIGFVSYVFLQLIQGKSTRHPPRALGHHPTLFALLRAFLRRFPLKKPQFPLGFFDWGV